MALLAPINASQTGSFTSALTTLTAADTLTFDTKKRQLLVLRNPTGGSLTLKIDGDGGTSVPVDGLGSVSVASGFDIVVPAGESRAVVLNSIRHYCQGVVNLTGASGMVAQLFEFTS